MKKIFLVTVLSFFSTAVLATDMPYRALAAQQVYSPIAAANWNGCYVGAAAGWDRVDGGVTLDGGIVGGTLGCNAQSANWVFGVESDALWNSVKSAVLGGGDQKQDFLGSVRGRLGIATPTALLYGTGGLGIGHLKISSPLLNMDDTHTGWVAGGGYEWVVATHWTAKVEYLHYGFDDVGGGSYKVDSVKVGLNYQFGR
jgi:outer membrane immunogenic protein